MCPFTLMNIHDLHVAELSYRVAVRSGFYDCFGIIFLFSQKCVVVLQHNLLLSLLANALHKHFL